jgi:TonB family protein
MAKADASNKARIFLKDAGHASDSHLGESRGEGSAGSVFGTMVYQAPVLLFRVIPGYPESARRLGVEGPVVLRFVVDQFGRVEGDIEVVTSLPMLDKVAIDAVRQWRFSPGRDRDGNPVRVQVSIPIQFTLR